MQLSSHRVVVLAIDQCVSSTRKTHLKIVLHNCRLYISNPTLENRCRANTKRQPVAITRMRYTLPAEASLDDAAVQFDYLPCCAIDRITGGHPGAGLVRHPTGSIGLFE